MNRHLALRQLDATRAGLARIAAELHARHRALHGRAEAHALDVEEREHPSSRNIFGRHSTYWRKRQEAWFQEALRHYVTAEAASLRAMLTRFDRLESQVAAQTRRLGVNEPRTFEHAGADLLARKLLAVIETDPP